MRITKLEPVLPLPELAKIDWRTALALTVTVVLWGTAFPAIRAGLEAYQPGHVALLRFIVAASTLIVYAVISKMPLPLIRDVPTIALMGGLGITAYNVLLNNGQQTVASGAASFLIATSPVMVAVLAIIFLVERLRVVGWLGIAVCLAGVLVIILGRGGEFEFDTHALLILGAALVQALFFVIQKPFLRRYPPLHLMTYVIVAGLFFLMIFLPGLPNAVRHAPLDSTLAVVFLGVFPAAIGYFTYAYVLARIPASRASTFLYFVPVVASVSAWLWLGEVLTVLAVVGGALVLFGVVIVNVYGRRPNPI
jgi:drug/metabolite transporter (DMT)-like permease